MGEAHHARLLEQARHLLKRERRRPKQASLRRAVSAAYYALFHLLIYEAVRRIAGTGSPRRIAALSRAFEHRSMSDASKAFTLGHLPEKLGHASPSGKSTSKVRMPTPTPTPADLQLVAETFVNLQAARHRADYNLGARFTRQEASDLVDDAEQAFEAWERVRDNDTEAAADFLFALAFWDRLRVS